ncbi:hypothetical protein NY96_12075 [Xanthomonas citri pv. fuscans]|nr:hypothetical protein NY96_12075 [Xanthomonas citri pv. fuscans]TBW92919.1 hypothetical protein TP49_23845 [Xanthomonas citri pv. aurantifolii]
MLAAFPLVPIVFFLPYELADILGELRVADAKAVGVIVVDRPQRVPCVQQLAESIDVGQKGGPARAAIHLLRLISHCLLLLLSPPI